MSAITHEREEQPHFPQSGQPSPWIQRLLPTGRRDLLARMEASALVLAMMWLFIAAIATVDVYCSIKYDYELLTEELNPIGRWLMKLDGGSVGLFMACKFFCNLVALGSLQLLYFFHRPLCLIAAGVLTALQGVLAFLLLG